MIPVALIITLTQKQAIPAAYRPQIRVRPVTLAIAGFLVLAIGFTISGFLLFRQGVEDGHGLFHRMYRTESVQPASQVRFYENLPITAPEYWMSGDEQDYEVDHPVAGSGASLFAAPSIHMEYY